MSPPIYLPFSSSSKSFPRTDDQIRQLYGCHAIIVRIPGFNLIFPDHPDEEEVRKRVASFDPSLIFDDRCPLCQALRKSEIVDVVCPGTPEEVEA